MKANIKSWIAGASVGLLLGGATLFTSGCAAHVGYASGPNGAYYDYDYYPGLNVYYYPSGGVYHWNDHGHWMSGQRLPEHYTLGNAHHERLRYHSQQPWTEHGEHFEGH